MNPPSHRVDPWRSHVVVAVVVDGRESGFARHQTTQVSVHPFRPPRPVSKQGPSIR
jgi:hypothetical protein